MNIEILDVARQDLVDGFRFYENRARGLGGYFLDSLFSDIDFLRLYAGVHVYAVLDCRCNPAWVRDRLE